MTRPNSLAKDSNSLTCAMALRTILAMCASLALALPGGSSPAVAAVDDSRVRVSDLHQDKETKATEDSVPITRKKKRTRKRRGKRVVRGNAPCLAWIDHSQQSKAVILCVHGLGLHNGTYAPFGKVMSEKGFAVYAIDVRGFGSWMEAKGREKVDFHSCLDDVRRTLKVIRRAHPGLPVFLLGESMGGAIALRITARYPELVDGLISSVPAGDRFKRASTTLKVALHLINAPNKPFNVGEGVVKQATKKPDLREAWLSDPLARLNLSPRELIQFEKFMHGNHASARKIKDKPVLIVQGCKDKLVKPESTVELFNELATMDRQIILVPNAEHLIFEENQFTEKNIQTVTSWLEAHMPQDRTE